LSRRCFCSGALGSLPSGFRFPPLSSFHLKGAPISNSPSHTRPAHLLGFVLSFLFPTGPILFFPKELEEVFPSPTTQGLCNKVLYASSCCSGNFFFFLFFKTFLPEPSLSLCSGRRAGPSPPPFPFPDSPPPPLSFWVWIPSYYREVSLFLGGGCVKVILQYRCGFGSPFSRIKIPPQGHVPFSPRYHHSTPYFFPHTGEIPFLLPIMVFDLFFPGLSCDVDLSPSPPGYSFGFFFDRFFPRCVCLQFFFSLLRQGRPLRPLAFSLAPLLC